MTEDEWLVATPAPVERRTVLLPDGRVVDAVIGYRMWFYDQGLKLLRSVTHDVLWQPNTVMIAECLPFASASDEQRADWVCRCGDYLGPKHGLYAYRTLADLEHATFHDKLSSVILGEVALFGGVAVHELGYRADRALLLGLHSNRVSELVMSCGETVRRVLRQAVVRETSQACERYGVPLLS